MGTYTYNAYGLTLTLPFACSGLSPAAPGTIADVTVHEGEVPARLSAGAIDDGDGQIEPGRTLLFGGPRQGRFLIQAGEVTLQRHPRATDEALGRALTNRVLPPLLTQRGMLVLHGNAAATEHGAIVITGSSGAGKSTTLAGLLDHGATMVSDDITAIGLTIDGLPVVGPGQAKIHLTPEATDELGYRIAPGDRRLSHRGKHTVVPGPERMSSGPVALRAIFELAPHAGGGLHRHTLTGAAKFAALQRSIYGPLLPAEHPRMFATWSTILRQVRFLQIARPRDTWTISQVCDAMLEVASAA